MTSTIFLKLVDLIVDGSRSSPIWMIRLVGQTSIELFEHMVVDVYVLYLMEDAIS